MSSNFDSDCGFETNRNEQQCDFSSDIFNGSTLCYQSDDKNEIIEEEAMEEQVFSIVLLLKQILKNLEIRDLLNTSLINKSWNFFSREILRENRNCLAIINERNPCRELERLNSLLLNSGCEAIPFSGLSISNPSIDEIHYCPNDRNVTELTNNILEKIRIKYLSLTFHYSYECISLKCIREIIVKKASLLEGLSLKSIPSYDRSFSHYIGLDLQGQWLANLKFLEFPFILHKDYVPNEFIKCLVEASPKLQEIRGMLNEQCLEFILSLNLASAVKDFYLRPSINSLRNCLAFSLENPKLNKFRLSTSHVLNDEVMFSRWSHSSQNDLIRAVRQLLESSKDSLNKIALDQYDLILMTTDWNIPTLKNVAHLSVRYCNSVDIFEGYDIFRKIEWAKYFPNLQEISVATESFEDLETDAYLCNAFWKSNAHFVCDTVKRFRLLANLSYVGETGLIQMFQKIFPNVAEVYLLEVHKVATDLQDLWTAWRNLEAIYMRVVVASMRVAGLLSCRNLDSVFLGISEQEAAYLLQNVEDLESLEIVPTKHSIFNLQKLKKLEMRLFENGLNDCGNRSTSSDSDFLTRLVGKCAFSRLPGLSVEIHRCRCEAQDNCCIALNDLQPFVKFVECDKSPPSYVEFF